VALPQPTLLGLLLLLQGVAGLFVGVFLGTLYTHRRSLNLLYWSLSWLAQGSWLVLWGMLIRSLEPAHLGRVDVHYPIWHQLAGLLAWLAMGCWIVGWRLYRPGRIAPLPVVGDGAPLRFHWWQVAVLLASVALGFLTSVLFDRMVQMGTLALAWTGGFGWSVFVLLNGWRRTRRLGSAILALTLGVLTVFCFVHGWRSFGDPVADPARSLNHAVLHTCLMVLVAVCMVVVVLDDEQRDLRQAVNRLVESEDRFRLIFEHSGVGMALFAPDGLILQTNPSLVRMLGYSDEELRGKRLTDFTFHQDVTIEQPAFSPPLSANSPLLYEREKRYVHKTGRSIWARVLRVPVKDDDGQVRYYVGVLVDITERRIAEEALAASEQQLRLLNQVAGDGIHVTDERSRFLDVNPALTQMLGYSREELLHSSLLDMAVERSALVQYHQSILQGGRRVRLETQLRCRDGHTVEVELSGGLLLLEGRTLVHGICRDVSERKRAEAALAEARETLQQERDFSTQILETADVLIIVVDSEGKILRFNETAAKLASRPEEAVRGQAFVALFPERAVTALHEVFDRLFTDLPGSQQAPIQELPWKNDSDDERLIAWRYSVVRDAHQKVRYVICTGIDITEQRQLEEQLRQARKMETLGALVGGIAHDFNNQLTAVLGNLGLVLSDLHPGKPSDEHPHVLHLPVGRTLNDLVSSLRDAERAGQHCAEITQRLLTFSRGRVGAVRTLTVSPLLGEAVRSLQRALPPSIQVEVREADVLWPVLADPAQLHQVLISLLTNANEAMPQGGRITLFATNRTLDAADCVANLESRPGRFVAVSVRDTGCGIAPEVRRHLFEPFFTTKGNGQGAGMGLAMAYGIIRAHKGWIEVESEVGQGSTFTILLPATEKLAPIPTPPRPPNAPPTGECVLIVDDEDLVRNLARITLERRGFRCLTARDGEEGLAVFRRHQADIDVVLLDYVMPRLTGLQVFQVLKEIDPDVNVVFSSGYTMDNDSDQLLATGARAFLPKPYHPEELLRTLRRVLDQPAVT